ncbi:MULTISPECIES: DUF4064 domain-containing protein [Mammaliicoccus]|uniref:DUF4064 domain-containing protein n=2 Tax=Staphylococcaceae TaxID=90964 RepID=A0ABS5MJN9_9STAP|nr:MULTISPECIES: DUF4064 domain-containing protein [Mammaliicoccus]HCN60912.1 DUF4064 domain-containing protein [Staphylococcus sp.]MBL0846620.1 DUF4064 domain-containing protein [Mammaliicoccus fleurettii]MBS3696120.1 DUF4064 domain-containing protein [Mammaliicoccus fleurettii]MEB7805348.1 DUF4064 domain-containing protein [Mammaliicoccus fleurettii]PTE34307.1 DUF4064 domain-containing protein [Mammaliicoccus fleurettii]
MMNSYVEHVRQPVSRGVEKFLGWLSWIILLGVTALSLFAALVVLNNPNNLNRLESLINRLNINITANGQLLSASDVALNIQNGIWLFIIYLIIVLIFSFIGLVMMRWRVFAAIVFLLLAIITIPLFIVLVPLFFFIVSILLFVRKDKILPIQGMEQQQSFQDNQGRVNNQPRQSESRQSQPMESNYQQKNEQNNEKAFIANQPNTKEEEHVESQQHEVHSETTNNEEVLSRSKKHQKHQKQNEQMNEFNNEQVEFDQNEVNNQEDLGQRNQDPYNYETTHSDEYQVQPGRQKKEKKVKKEKPNATFERRNNYEKRMQQQKNYFEEKNNSEQDVEKKDK